MWCVRQEVRGQGQQGGLLILALFALLMALLPNGAATLEALAKVLATPVVVLLLVRACLGRLPWQRR